jgi:hypothetical protein
MEDAHLEIPKHVLLDGCMYLSYQILSLGYLFSGEGIWRDLLSQAYCNSNIEIEKVAPHMLSTYISPCATTFVPSLRPQVYRANPAMLYETFPFFIQPLLSVMASFLPSFCSLDCMLVLPH